MARALTASELATVRFMRTRGNSASLIAQTVGFATVTALIDGVIAGFDQQHAEAAGARYESFSPHQVVAGEAAADQAAINFPVYEGGRICRTRQDVESLVRELTAAGRKPLVIADLLDVPVGIVDRIRRTDRANAKAASSAPAPTADQQPPHQDGSGAEQTGAALPAFPADGRVAARPAVVGAGRGAHAKRDDRCGGESVLEPEAAATEPLNETAPSGAPATTSRGRIKAGTAVAVNEATGQPHKGSDEVRPPREIGEATATAGPVNIHRQSDRPNHSAERQRIVLGQQQRRLTGDRGDDGKPLRPYAIQPGFQGSPHKTCQWIEGEPEPNDSCKCGKKVLTGTSYCRAHALRAFRVLPAGVEA